VVLVAELKHKLLQQELELQVKEIMVEWVTQIPYLIKLAAVVAAQAQLQLTLQHLEPVLAVPV
jgi:hypothetical protein